MARVKGPNGLVLTFSEQVAEGLLKSSEYSLVKDDEAPSKKAAPKPSTKK